MDRHLPHETARNARFVIGILNAAKMGILSAGQHQAAPADYAMTEHNLGAAYAGLPSGDRAANLARAIECFTEALRFFTAEAAPAGYAATEHNLGAAYAGLLSGDRAANLARAIECFTEALRFYTAEVLSGAPYSHGWRL